MHLSVAVSFLLVIFTEFHFGLGNECARKCKGKFSKPTCKETSYVQLGSCAYACVCDGHHSYYVEETFKKCSPNKKCYQGDCLVEIPELCEKNYGPDFIGLENPGNPCVYYCYSVDKPCMQYEEDKPTGSWCYTFESRIGQCLQGLCAAELPPSPHHMCKKSSTSFVAAPSSTAPSYASSTATSTASASATAESVAASSTASDSIAKINVNPSSGTEFSFHKENKATNTGILAGASAGAGFVASSKGGTKTLSEMPFLPNRKDGLVFTDWGNAGTRSLPLSYAGTATAAKPAAKFGFFGKPARKDTSILDFKRGINPIGGGNTGISTVSSTGWIGNPFAGLFSRNRELSGVFANTNPPEQSFLGNQFGGEKVKTVSFSRTEVADASKAKSFPGSKSFPIKGNDLGTHSLAKSAAGTEWLSGTGSRKPGQKLDYGSGTGIFEGSSINTGSFSKRSEMANNYESTERRGSSTHQHISAENDFSNYEVQEEKSAGRGANKRSFTKSSAEKETFSGSSTNPGSHGKSNANSEALSINAENGGFHPRDRVNARTFSGSSYNEEYFSDNSSEEDSASEDEMEDEYFAEARNKDESASNYESGTSNFREAKSDEESFSESGVRGTPLGKSEFRTDSFSKKGQMIGKDENSSSGRLRGGSDGKRIFSRNKKSGRFFYGSEESKKFFQLSKKVSKINKQDESFRQKPEEDFS